MKEQGKITEKEVKLIYSIHLKEFKEMIIEILNELRRKDKHSIFNKELENSRRNTQSWRIQ